MTLWKLQCTHFWCLSRTCRRLACWIIRYVRCLATHDHHLVSILFCDYAWQIHETVEQINAIKLQREFYLGFSDNPQKFINDWLASQNRDLKVCVYVCVHGQLWFGKGRHNNWSAPTHRWWKTRWVIQRQRESPLTLSGRGARKPYLGTSTLRSARESQSWSKLLESDTHRN